MKMKLKVLLLIGIVVALVATGCNNGSTPNATASADPNAAQSPPNQATNQGSPAVATNIPEKGSKSSIHESNRKKLSQIKVAPLSDYAAGSLESNRLYPLNTLKTVNLKCAGHTFPVWVMDNYGKLDEGLMYLKNKDIPNNHGAIFVFGTPGPQNFWMDNTYIPLDIVFISANGTVLNRVVGKKMDRTSLPSKGNALYVIELKAGEAGPLGLNPGAKVIIPKSVVFRNDS